MSRPRPSLPLPTWATDASHSAPGKAWDTLATKVDPGAGRRATGYQPEERPPAEFYNHDLNKLGQWIEHIQFMQAQNFFPVEYAGAPTPSEGEGIGYIAATGLWVVVGAGSDVIHISDDGYDWTDLAPASPQGVALQTVVEHPSLALLFGDSENYYLGSGTAGWLAKVLPGTSDQDIYDGVWDTANSQFVIVGREDPGAGDASRIYTSATGDTGSWTSRTVPSPGFSPNKLNMVAANPSTGRLVAYGRNTTGALYTSDDGATWTLRTSPGPDAVGLAFSVQENRFMLVFANGDVKTSSDGETWSTVATLTTGGFTGGTSSQSRNCLANHGSLWMAAGASGGVNYVKYSGDNGVTWYRYPMPGAFGGRTVRHGDNRFIYSGLNTVATGLIRLGADASS